MELVREGYFSQIDLGQISGKQELRLFTTSNPLSSIPVLQQNLLSNSVHLWDNVRTAGHVTFIRFEGENVAELIVRSVTDTNLQPTHYQLFKETNDWYKLALVGAAIVGIALLWRRK